MGTEKQQAALDDLAREWIDEVFHNPEFADYPVSQTYGGIVRKAKQVQRQSQLKEMIVPRTVPTAPKTKVIMDAGELQLLLVQAGEVDVDYYQLSFKTKGKWV